MKKIILSLLVFAAISVSAATTAKAKITITGVQTGNNGTVTLLQNDSYADAFDANASAIMSMADRKVALYAWYNNTEYQIFGSKDLGTLAFGLKTDASTDYTLKATNVAGTLYIYDEVDKKYFELTEGAVYNFTATANETNTTRFHLAAAPAPAVPGICHQNGRLEFTAYEGASVQVVGYEDNTVVAVPATDITLAYQEIDLAALAAGQYLVIVTKADQTEEKLVIKK